jgi:putative DNA methylase
MVRLSALKTRSPHKENPRVSPQILERFSKVKLLDPFAGFGSIPLEAMRLGIGEVVAVELLPTAYVFLKAVLEYPKEFGERLVKDVERWGRWVTDRLREDPDVKELYDEGVAVYIGTWEVKCPHCGRYTPLVGN